MTGRIIQSQTQTPKPPDFCLNPEGLANSLPTVAAAGGKSWGFHFNELIIVQDSCHYVTILNEIKTEAALPDGSLLTPPPPK